MNGTETHVCYKTTPTGQNIDFTSQIPELTKTNWMKAFNVHASSVQSATEQHEAVIRYDNGT